ncbi:MAG: LamG domain-containing protein [Saprospiraceae bacterium]
MSNTIDWGQGAVNNTIDWGKGKTNNTINWAEIYDSTPAGETNITGSGGVTPFVNTYSMEFDGIDEYVDCNSISALNSASTVTISMWCKKSSTSNVNVSVGSLVSSTNGIWLQWFTDNTLYFTIRNGAIMTTSYALSGDTDWHNIIGVYNGVNAKIYVDGNLVVTGTNIPSSLSSTAGNNFEIGALNGGFFTSGNIDEVAVWNSELSASDVTTIYNSGAPNDLTSLSPVSWWRMGDGDTWNGSSWTLTDNGSGGNDATSVNMEEADRLPISPNSYSLSSFSFDGIDEYLTLGAPLNLRILGSVSVSCWVKYTDSGGTRYINSFGDKYGLYTSGGKLIWHYRNPSNQFLNVASLSNFNDGEWHHVMGVNDETNLKIYIDGVLNNSNTNGSTGIAGATDSRIGARWNNANYFEGSIDEFYIWDSDQSANISTIYGNGVPTDISALNPLGHWRMGESATWNGSQWTLTDQGSGGNNGTSVNMEEADKTGDQPYVI